MAVHTALHSNSSPRLFLPAVTIPLVVYDQVKKLEELRAEMEEEYLLAKDAGKLAIRARETGRLHRTRLLIIRKIAP